MGCDSFSYLVLFLTFLKNIYEVCSQNNTMVCWNISNISYKVLKKMVKVICFYTEGSVTA